MAIVKILQYPTPLLKRVGRPITDFGPATQRIIDDMFETHYATSNCAALAATQLDIPEAPAITVIDFSSAHNQPLCLVNPRVEAIDAADTLTEEEGCMSVPGGVFESVTRPKKIRVHAQDRTGKELVFEADGFMAKCIQHEVDHLNGKIFLDHLKPLKRKRIDEKLAKHRKKQARQQTCADDCGHDHE